jgi:DNA-binding NtrC family response regulator
VVRELNSLSARPPTPKESPMNPTPPRRILVVDDEEHVLSALKRTLKKEGYELFVANEPAEGLKLLRANAIDLVISDHLMPNMTGLEFLKIVRDRHPDTIRMMLTGHADMQTAVDAINHGEIHRFLTKPWDDLELKVTLYLAFERLDIERENRRLLAMVRRQTALIESLEHTYPGIGKVLRESDGAIRIEA